jgi:hypothetical protein
MQPVPRFLWSRELLAALELLWVVVALVQVLLVLLIVLAEPQRFLLAPL